MDLRHKIRLAVAFLFASCTIANAQEWRGGIDNGTVRGVEPRLGFANVTSPEQLRDSLAFARRAKDSLWQRPNVQTWHSEEMAAQSAEMRNISRIASASGGTRFTQNPFAYDFANGGVIAAWRDGAMVGSSFRVTMPALMSRQNATVGVVQNVGNLTVTANVSANRYWMWRNTTTAFGVSGSATYRFNDNVSATVFGHYSTNNMFHSMAAMPYMSTSGYGGFMTFMGETLGMDVGVERYYDSFSGRWTTSPIITPKIKFSENFTLDLPVGWLVKEALDNAFNKDKNNRTQIIMPEMPSMPGKIPFAAPELPKR